MHDRDHKHDHGHDDDDDDHQHLILLHGAISVRLFRGYVSCCKVYLQARSRRMHQQRLLA